MHTRSSNGLARMVTIVPPVKESSMADTASNERQRKLFKKRFLFGVAIAFLLFLIMDVMGVDNLPLLPSLGIKILIGAAFGFLVGVIIRLWRRFRAKSD